MLKSKKVVLLSALAIAMLSGSIAAGVTLAQSGSGNETQANTRYETLLNKVATIYQQNTGVAIDPQQLGTAFTQAQKEMQDERLQDLVTQGKITQDQADKYKIWWQSRPDDVLPGIGLGERFGGRGFRMDRWWSMSPATTTAPNQ